MLGISSSQLTFSNLFQRGRSTTSTTIKVVVEPKVQATNEEEEDEEDETALAIQDFTSHEASSKRQRKS